MVIPVGKLIAIGGNEAKDDRDDDVEGQQIDFKNGILMDIISEMKSKKPVLEIIPVASSIQDEVGKNYMEAFKKLGLNVKVMIVPEKENVDDTENLERIGKANGIFLTGGDQLKLRDMLEGTKLLDIIRERYLNEKFVIAGTSAGAMVMSEMMINTGESEESVLKGVVKLTAGLNFLPGTIIDTHFFNRGRFARLTEALLQKHKLTGIGISEDSGVVVTEGNMMRAIGSGTVLIMDNHEIKNTNYSQIKAKQPLYVENLIVHILSKGAAYMLREKKFVIV